MLRKKMFLIAEAACQRPDSAQCEYVVGLLEEIVHISSSTLKSRILLANREIRHKADRGGLERVLRADMERLGTSIRKINDLCSILDCDDLGHTDGREFAECFIEEVMADRRHSLRTVQ